MKDRSRLELSPKNSLFPKRDSKSPTVTDTPAPVEYKSVNVTRDNLSDNMDIEVKEIYNVIAGSEGLGFY